MEKMKLFKKKALKALPFVLGAIPGAAAVAKMVEAYNWGIQSQLMMRNADLTHAQYNMTEEYFKNVCDYIRASYSGDSSAKEEAYSKVYGIFDIYGYSYQTELEVLGADAKKAMRDEIFEIENRAITDTMKDLNLSSHEELIEAMKRNPSIYQNEYKDNILKNTDIAEANFENTDYMTSLQDSIPTVGEYFDVVHAADYNMNWGATLGASALAVGCVTQLVLDRKYKKLVKENDTLNKDEKSL